jgi:hypothetical protein
MYYKTKLQVHNMTFYCLEDASAFCYVWDETDGGLKADVFAWLQYHHFKKFLESHPHIRKLIIWSDGCGYQNRNSTVANAYLHLAKELGVEILQKCLVSRHTQMECDSMHSVIERKVRGEIFTPREYVVVMQCACKIPQPYHVQQLNFSHFPTGLAGCIVHRSHWV